MSEELNNEFPETCDAEIVSKIEEQLLPIMKQPKKKAKAV